MGGRGAGGDSARGREVLLASISCGRSTSVDLPSFSLPAFVYTSTGCICVVYCYCINYCVHSIVTVSYHISSVFFLVQVLVA